MFNDNSKKKIMAVAALSAVGAGVALLVARRRGAAAKLEAAKGKAKAAGKRLVSKVKGKAQRAARKLAAGSKRTAKAI